MIIASLALLACSCKKESVSRSVAAQQTGSDLRVNHYIGEPFGGGIIFSLDDSAKHGLIVSKEQTLATWWNGQYVETFATSTVIGAGARNTRKIIRAQGTTGSYAALLCAKFKRDHYTDWYLPSLGELFELYTQKNVIGGFENAPYWSSTEDDKNNAWYQNFSLGNQFTGSKDGVGYVRAVRSF
jgi:hypothetical protein